MSWVSGTILHKTPAIWSKESNLPTMESNLSLKELRNILPELNYSQVFQEMMDGDIYVNIFLELCKLNSISEVNIVQGFTAGERANWGRELNEGYFRLDNNITFWSLSSPEHLGCFINSNILMTRGQYPILHSRLSENRDVTSGCWIHYPATAMMFPKIEHVIQNWKESLKKDKQLIMSNIRTFLSSRKGRRWAALKTSLGELPPNEVLDRILHLGLEERLEWSCDSYDVTLVDDFVPQNPKGEIFPGAQLVQFNKPLPPNAKSSPSRENKFDLIFAGTTIGPTKNHSLLLELLNHFDQILHGRKISLCILGDEGSLPWFSKSLRSEYSNIEINNIGVVSREETLNTFSQSKICLILSGRDCNPRLISEATSQGCRVIALNLMSDGFQALESNPSLGKIIEIPLEEWNFDKQASPFVRASAELAENILDETFREQTPLFTSMVSRNIFDLEKSAIEINNSIQIFR